MAIVGCWGRVVGPVPAGDGLCRSDSGDPGAAEGLDRAAETAGGGALLVVVVLVGVEVRMIVRKERQIGKVGGVDGKIGLGLGPP